MIDLLVQSVFLGFALFLILKGVASTFKLNSLDEVTKRFNNSVVWAVCFTGILFSISFVVGFIVDLLSSDEDGILTEGVWTPRSFWLFMYILTYGVFSQLLWVKKIKSSKWFKVIFVCLILFTFFFERFVVFMSSFHRDYVPSSWTTIRGVWWATIMDSFLYTLVFIAVIIIIYSVSNFKNLNVKKPFLILAVTAIFFITIFKACYLLLMMQANLPEYANYFPGEIPDIKDVVSMEFRNLTEIISSIVTALIFATAVLIIIGKKLKKGTIAGNTILLSLFLSSLYLLITMLAAIGYEEDYFDIRWQETGDEVMLLLITFLLVAFPLAIYFKERIKVSQVLP